MDRRKARGYHRVMRDAMDHLRGLLARHWHAKGRETQIDGLFLSHAEQPSDIMRSIYRTSFCVVLQGSKISLLGEQAWRYTQGQYLIASMDLPVTAQIVEASPDRPYMAFSLTIDPAMIAELVVELEDASPAAERGPLVVGALDPSLLDPLIRLFALLDTPRDLPVLAPLIRREIVWRLLNGPHGGSLRQIGLAGGAIARIARVLRWITDHYADPISIDELAGMAAMSAASLHRHFKAATTLTPIQFQKQVRLQAARRLLLSETNEAAAAGFAVGYESASQFNRDYRRLFGQPPRRDVSAIRRDVTADLEV
ncbi:AraC family transcriptional regulator [Sphingobium xenophagum]|nr:AraC family transcriptional regulator [Sphingobium xenophagum]